MRLPIAKLPTKWVIGLAIVLAALHAFMAASVSRQFSTTFDEIAHVTAGYVYWTEVDLRFQPENGNLPQRLAGLPLLLMDIPPLPPEHPAWKNGDVWDLGETFFYQNGIDSADLLAVSRGVIALLSGGLCFLVFWWSRQLFGDTAGLFSQLLATFSPTLLAHGGLATSDSTTGLMFLAASLAWWRVCHRITWQNVLLAGLTAGLLAVSKLSAVLFAPMAAIMLIVRLLHPAPLLIFTFRGPRASSGWPRLLPLLAVAAVSILIAWSTIWTFYGFRFQPSQNPNHTEYLHHWNELLMQQAPSALQLVDGRTDAIQPVSFEPGPVQAVAQLGLDHHLLPEAYIHGLLLVDRYSRSRLAFFAGEFRNTGWWTFFPTAFLVKTPLPALMLIALGFFSLILRRQHPGLWYHLTPLIALTLIYGTVIVTSNLNIGHRHTLPLYPVLFIVAGAVVPLFANRRWLGLTAGLLLITHIGVSWGIRPHYLAYFNPIGGGSLNAHKLFVDSSLDWGQDLPGLARWLEEKPHPDPVFISYFGKGQPTLEGIKATRFGDSFFDNRTRQVPASVRGGTFAISATMLQRVYSPVRGPWTPGFEATYLNLRAWIARIVQQEPGAAMLGPNGVELSPDDAKALMWKFEDLQFGRLCHYLTHRTPDDHVGYSILIYTLSDEEVSLALHAPLSELNAAIASQISD